MQPAAKACFRFWVQVLQELASLTTMAATEHLKKPLWLMNPGSSTGSDFNMCRKCLYIYVCIYTHIP